MAPAPATLADTIRQHDRERYLTALFAPSDRRGDLLALYAFNLEVAKTREVVREPMLGQIRLQWWRDALDEIFAGKPVRRHETVAPLAEAVLRRNLPREPFERLLIAREQDLEDAPFASLSELETYAEATSGELMALALVVLGAADPTLQAIARRIGRGYALTGLLRAVPFHARQHRCLLPTGLLAAHGTDPDAVLSMKSSPGLVAAVTEVAEAAEAALWPARIPAVAWPALAPAILARRHLRRIHRAAHDVFAPEVAAEPGPGAILALIGNSILRRA
ncbi:MAG: squalene/phytoene synthase family protein [Alphaproteobacteria bacterium]|nr:squalene/phytoene synthase family protein [Alphaproteobacteria bacterium]